MCKSTLLGTVLPTEVLCPVCQIWSFWMYESSFLTLDTGQHHLFVSWPCYFPFAVGPSSLPMVSCGKTVNVLTVLLFNSYNPKIWDILLTSRRTWRGVSILMSWEEIQRNQRGHLQLAYSTVKRFKLQTQQKLVVVMKSGMMATVWLHLQWLSLMHHHLYWFCQDLQRQRKNMVHFEGYKAKSQAVRQVDAHQLCQPQSLHKLTEIKYV